MKQLIAAILILVGLGSCSLGDNTYTPRAGDFSGKVFNAAFPEGSPILREMTPQDMASLKCQFVFNVNATGTAVFKTDRRLNAPSFSWRIQNDSLIINLQGVDNRFAVKKLGDDFELNSLRLRFVLYKPKA